VKQALPSMKPMNSPGIPEKGKGQSDFSDWPLFEAIRRRERASFARGSLLPKS